MSAAFAGAIDLSALKQPASPPPTPDGKPSPYVVEVNESSFSQIVQVSAEIPVVFEMYSNRSPTAAQSATLAGLADRAGGAWVLARADVDASPRIAQAFGVQAVPTVIAVAGGQPVDGYTGVQTEPQIKAWVTSLLDLLRERMPAIRTAEEAAGVESEPAPEPVDPRFLAAEDLLDAGDFAGAKAAYQAILDQEPANGAAAAALAQTDLLARVQDAPPDAVALAQASPDDVSLQLTAADVELAGGDPQAAFDRLIRTVSGTAGDDRAAVRDHLVALFSLFPADDPDVRAARRKLAAALY